LAPQRGVGGGGRKRKGGVVRGDEENDDDSKDNNDGDDDDDNDDDEAMDDDRDDVAEWEKTKSDPLPVEQAWENWELVRRFRVDPPLSIADPTNSVDGPEGGNGREFASIGERTVATVPTKIHVFSIDWAPFKQIRTDDIMSYFRDYGPSYVEWLGELSCNVLFEDKHSAARAFRALSRELPSPPPPSVGSVAAMDDPIGGGNGGGGGDAMGDDRDMIAGDDDGEMNAIDAATDDDGERGSGKGQRKEDEESIPDFGSMGWRFCKWTVRKVRGIILF
jgi:hypothetical protein